ncbi:hypothetical protein MTO96_017499 [Rhipicephalus appendiculatus]
MKRIRIVWYWLAVTTATTRSCGTRQSFGRQHQNIGHQLEANGTPCWVDRNYPKGTCRYSRCRQPNMKKRWWFGKLFRRRPKDSKE